MKINDLEAKDEKHDHDNEDDGEKTIKLCGVDITPLILLLALGFHSIFEGIALGLIKDI